MSEDPTKSHAVSGGSSAVPTPANSANRDDNAAWGDRVFRKGGSENEPINQGLGHVHASNPRATTGGFLGLRDQKSRAQNKYLEQAGLADDMQPMREDGEPTCEGEDHSFMGRKPGKSDTYPGWDTAKSFFGAGNPN